MMAGQFVGPCRLAARHGTTSSNPISSSGESAETRLTESTEAPEVGPADTYGLGAHRQSLDDICAATEAAVHEHGHAAADRLNDFGRTSIVARPLAIYLKAVLPNPRRREAVRFPMARFAGRGRDGEVIAVGEAGHIARRRLGRNLTDQVKSYSSVKRLTRHRTILVYWARSRLFTNQKATANDPLSAGN